MKVPVYAATVAANLLLALASAVAVGAEPVLPTGLDVAGIDAAVKPGDDFFAYANGTWLKNTEIPADESSYGTWNMIYQLTERQLVDLIQQDAAGTGGASSEARLVGDYYTAFMDEERIEALGLSPLAPTRKAIDAIVSRQDLARYLGTTLRADVDVLNATMMHTDNLFGLWIAQDFDHPDRYVPFLLQGGLCMPDASYYTASAPAMVDIRAKYATHVTAMFKLAGVSDPAARAARVIELEHSIAAVHWTREQNGDPKTGNNRWLRSDFARRAPGLDWQTYFAAAGLSAGQKEFIVWQPSAFKGISALVASAPLDTWKDYLLLHALERRAAVLPKAFVDQRFAFFGHELGGAPEQQARWKRGVTATDRALGDAVGKQYAAKYFSPEAKARIQAMVEQLRAAFAKRIDALDWMAPATKAAAKAKLAVLQVGVGYPDHWRDYSGLVVTREDAYGNADRASLFEYHYQLAKLGKPVDRTEWVMEPQTVNAVNLPVMNALNFPAAALQPPFFNPNGDPAQNYGAIGSVIGHEISHSFDDQGAQFDATGRLRNWWTADDLAHFEKSGTGLAAQFSAYKPFPDLAVNGRQTLGENIADVAGLSTALDAYHAEVGPAAANLDNGFTGDQRFFLGFAQNWRGKMRDQLLRRVVLTDGHAPEQYRALTVRNLDAWYAAFGVAPGDALYLAPADRVRVW